MIRDTQLSSWTATQKELANRQREVYEVIQVCKGAAGFEVARILHRPTYTVLPRITELSDAGLLKDSGRRLWNSETRRKVIVWEVNGHSD